MDANSGLLLIPLAWGHILIQDILVGVYVVDLDNVALRLASICWQIYDFLLLAVAFAHVLNGLRRVLDDYLRAGNTRQMITWALFVFWLVLSLIGAVAIIGGVRSL